MVKQTVDIGTIADDGTGDTARVAFDKVNDNFNELYTELGTGTALGNIQREPTEGPFVNGDKTKLDGIEAGADVTDTANVTAAGALMDSEVDADIKTLSLPANTTITAFAKTVLDDVDAAAARTTLGVDAAGTDNSTDVTLAGVGTYLSILGQEITQRALVESDISDLGTYQVQLAEGAFVNGDKTKLDGIESSADVTDATNVKAAIEAMTLGSVAGATGDEIPIIDQTDGGLKYVAWETLAEIVNDGTPQLGGNLDVNGNSIVSTANGNITLTPDGTGNVVLGNYTFDADQTVGASQDNYILTYDNASGTIRLESNTGGGGGIADIVEDTTPQLGGNLDVNGFSLVSVTNGDINITPNGTGNVSLGNFLFDADQTVGAGQDNYVLTYDNASGLISLEAASGGGGISNVVEDTTPQLGGNLDVNAFGITFPGATVTNITGADTSLVSGTAGTSGNLAQWDVNGDVIDGPAAPSGAVIGATDAQTLTNKTIDGDNNTISNLDIGNEVNWAVITDVADRTAFASGDKVLIFEAGVGMRKVDYDDLPGAGGGIANVVEDTTPQLGGDLDGQGNKIANYTNAVVTTVSGTLTTTAHSGNIIKTSGNITVPTTAGFTCTVIAGGAHTVTFNATTSAAMAAGDVMTLFVESSTVIHAVLTASADKVSFT